MAFHGPSVRAYSRGERRRSVEVAFPFGQIVIRIAATMSSKEDDILQAGAVPYRMRKGRLELCLITTRKGRWGFPKGIIDPGDTPKQTALKETEEEAGLLGDLTSGPIGSYRYRKWGSSLSVTMYLMEVTRAEKDWDESWRDRQWFSPEAAREIIDRDYLLPLVDAAEERLCKRVGK
jgi:8-oxo-dGTP pyrophosphatase MutT (NUDIX family)